MKKISILTVILLSTLQIVAQQLQLTVEFPKTDDVAGLKLYVAPMRGDYSGMKEMTVADNKYTYEVEASQFGFYNMMAIKSGTQLSMPLYIPVRTTVATVKAQLEDGKLVRFVGNADNEALSKFNLDAVARDRKLWTEKMTDDELRAMFGDFEKQAADADPDGMASQLVKDYLKIWAYISTYNSVASLPRVLRVEVDSVPFKCGDVLPEPTEVLDCDLATIFQASPNIIMRRMPEGKLAERIDWLRTNYKSEALRSNLERSMLESYVSKYDYWLHYNEGITELTAVVEKYGFDRKYVKEFEKNKIATKGSPFPADVVLKDTAGNVVDFSKFRGKYVYIDVWASWCGPCCKEVPNLQKLETELENENVVFLSLSVDTSVAPWKKKMAALNMHGNQLIDANKNFCKLLNIAGIPHCLIYDKEGKLHLYNAPRPSAGGIRYYLEDLK